VLGSPSGNLHLPLVNGFTGVQCSFNGPVGSDMVCDAGTGVPSEFGSARTGRGNHAANGYERTMSDSDKRGGGNTEGPNTGVVVKARPKTRKPAMYKVLMLNDDYTPMEFVVHVLERFFQKNREETTRIMLHVHRRGVGVCGVYTYEVAETKVTQVMDLARQNQHPLQCTIEKE